MLIVLAALAGDARLVVGAAIFVSTLVLLYSASTLYHFSIRDEVKKRLKVLDHCSIYLLIAGSYTPFTLVRMRSSTCTPRFFARLAPPGKRLTSIKA